MTVTASTIAERVSACSDCGTLVPTLRTGQGESGLPECPESTSTTMRGHRVSRYEFEAAEKEELLSAFPKGFNLVMGEPREDAQGMPQQVGVVTDEKGRVLFSFAMEARGDHPQFAVAGVDVKEPGTISGYTRLSSAPATTATITQHEPTAEEVIKSREDSLDFSLGYQFAKWQASGTRVPTGKSIAWEQGFYAAKKQTGRQVRKGVLVGQPRPY